MRAVPRREEVPGWLGIGAVRGRAAPPDCLGRGAAPGRWETGRGAASGLAAADSFGAAGFWGLPAGLPGDDSLMMLPMPLGWRG